MSKVSAPVVISGRRLNKDFMMKDGDSSQPLGMTGFLWINGGEIGGDLHWQIASDLPSTQ